MNLQAVKQALPYGAILEISKRTGIEYSVVNRTLLGNKTRKRLEIIQATAEYLTEYKAKEQETLQALKRAMSEGHPAQLAARIDRSREKYGEGTSPLH